jgi:hypothetical protein
MKAKDALIIAIATVGIITGACCAIVGGASGIAAAAAVIHLFAP